MFGDIMGKIKQPKLDKLIFASDRVSFEVDKLIPRYKKILSKRFIYVNKDFDLDLVPKNPGIYYFEASFRNFLYDEDMKFVDAFSNLWDETSENINVSALNKKRIKNYDSRIQSNEWVPFYLGKEQNLNSRLEQHIFSPTNNSTYALRLVDRGLIDTIDFRVTFVPINLYGPQYRNMQDLESGLRKLILPIVGKQ